MSVRGWILVCACAFMTMFANLLLRASVKKVEMLHVQRMEIIGQLWEIIKQPSFIFGVIFYFLSSVLWLKIISTEPLSLAYPILISITFLLVTLGAVIIFNETVTATKFIGIAIIVFGIHVLSKN